MPQYNLSLIYLLLRYAEWERAHIPIMSGQNNKWQSSNFSDWGNFSQCRRDEGPP